MAAFDVFDVATEKPARTNTLLARLAGVWAGVGRRHEDRKTLHKLYQLDEHVLRDMGFEPEEIYSAYEGAISETRGDRYPRV